MYIKTTNDLKKYIPVEKASYPESWSMYMVNAERKFIKPILGATLYEYIQTELDNNNLSADEQRLYEYCCNAIAHLGMYHLFPIAQTRISDKGVVTSQSQDHERITKWQFDEARTQFLLDGYTHLDQLLELLENGLSLSWYPAWTSGSGFSNSRKYFLNSAIKAAEFIPINNSRWIFAQFLPLMNNIEQLYIKPTIGDDFFDDLKTKYVNNNNTVDELMLIDKLCVAIALHCYQEGLRKPNIRQEMIITMSSRNDSIASQKNEQFAYEREADAEKIKAEHILSDIRQWLNKTASTTVFPIYFNSSKYKDPTLTISSSKFNNDCSNGSFFM